MRSATRLMEQGIVRRTASAPRPCTPVGTSSISRGHKALHVPVSAFPGSELTRLAALPMHREVDGLASEL